MPTDPGSAKPTADPDLTMTLPLGCWQVVMRCLGLGSFNQVATIVYRIDEQAEPRILAAQAMDTPTENYWRNADCFPKE